MNQIPSTLPSVTFVAEDKIFAKMLQKPSLKVDLQCFLQLFSGNLSKQRCYERICTKHCYIDTALDNVRGLITALPNGSQHQSLTDIRMCSGNFPKKKIQDSPCV